jgi:phage terminase large subunit-like protein
MPWQAHWHLVAGELIRDEETGLWLPAYPEAFATVMRQQGKTTSDVSFELDRAVAWESWDNKPQAIAYSAQSGSEGRKKFRKDIVPMIRRSPMMSTVDRFRFAAEDTGIEFKNGAHLDILATSEDAGHGMVYDLTVLDEIWADSDNRREQAAQPAMATRHDHQKILTSTAGHEGSVLYNSKQAKGRAAVVNGSLEGMAYLEYAADPKDDPEDPATWRACMPALGYTITERTVREALRQMRDEAAKEGISESDALAEFSRAWLNIVQRKGSARVIPADIWRLVLDATASPSGKLMFAVDGQPNQATTSIAAADPAGVCELTVHADGVSWALPKLVEMSRKWKAPVAVDISGPVGHLGNQLRQHGVKVIEFGPRDVAHACAEIYSRIADRRIRVRPNQCGHCDQVPITTAVEGLTQQPVGDGWRWARKSTKVDISPMMAMTLAVGAQAGIGAKPPVTPLFAAT